MRTYVLDANALLVFLEPKGGATKVRDILLEALHGRAAVLMSVVNLGEVYGVLLRLYGKDRAVTTLSSVYQSSVEFVDATSQRCTHAAEIKERYKLYYADSFAAALAIERKATLVTSDSDFRRLGHGFPILWLKA
jgi:predicted nucleic acid-binding protein